MRLKSLLFAVLFLGSISTLFAQQKVRDNTVQGGIVLPNLDAILELESANKGLLHVRLPLVMTTSPAPLSEHVAGMMVYNTASVNDVTPGIYYNDGERWVRIGAGGDGGGGDLYISYNPVTHEITYVDVAGNTQIINLQEVVQATETLTSLVNNGDGTVTYRDENGDEHTIVLANGPAGADGLSALEIWRELIGDPDASASDFIDALRGEDGADGADGKSAFEIWKEVVGDPNATELDFIDAINGTDGLDGRSAYEIAVSNGFVGDELAWLASLVGPAGADGVDGKSVLQGPADPLAGDGNDGDTYINTTSGDVYEKVGGTWVLTGNIQGPEGPQGETGFSSESQDGATGAPGIPGEPGGPGAGVTVVHNADGVWIYNEADGTWTNINGADGVDGVDGKSALEIWQELPGNDGKDGVDFIAEITGEDGADGADGKSAYEVAVDNGFVGSESDWLLSLIGDKGDDGKSALEIWQELPGNDGKDGADFIAEITGKDGIDGLDGKSAYDLAVEDGFTGTVTEWLESLNGQDGADGKSITEVEIVNGELIVTILDPETNTSTDENLGNVIGQDGKSIEDVTTADVLDPVTNEVIGTLVTFLDGDNNAVGSPVTVLNGKDGADGKSAFDIWKELPGNEDGTEQDFLDALKGVDGAMDLTEGTTTTVTGDGTPEDPYKVEVNSANLTVSEGIQFTGSTDGVDALLIETGIGIADGGITTAKLAEGAVTAAKMGSESAEAGTVPTSNGDGTVTYQAIPETPRFFYMPAVIFDTSVQGTATRDLYKDYVDQFTGAHHNISHGPTGTTPMQYTGGLIGSTNAPATIQVFDSDDMYYYVTYYDQDVFENLSIDESGKLTYTVKAGATETSYMNIVFVIK